MKKKPKPFYRVECFICEGVGGWYEDVGLVNPYEMPWYNCSRCDAIGHVSIYEHLLGTFWEHCPEWFINFYAKLHGW